MKEGFTRTERCVAADPVCDVLGHQGTQRSPLRPTSLGPIDRGSTGSRGSTDPHFFECGIKQCFLTPTFSCINR